MLIQLCASRSHASRSTSKRAMSACFWHSAAFRRIILGNHDGQINANDDTLNMVWFTFAAAGGTLRAEVCSRGGRKVNTVGPETGYYGRPAVIRRS